MRRNNIDEITLETPISRWHMDSTGFRKYNKNDRNSVRRGFISFFMKKQYGEYNIFILTKIEKSV